MQFEITIEDDLLHKVTNLGVPVHKIIADALWSAVEAAEAGEAQDEESETSELSDEPYVRSRIIYSGTSLYEIINKIRRENRKVYGRRARFTIYPDGNLLSNLSGTPGVSGPFIIEVRYPKNSLFQPKES